MSIESRSCARWGFPLLVVSSDDQVHSTLGQILKESCMLHRASGRCDALRSVRRFKPWVVVCDQNLADGDWRDLLTDLQEQGNTPLIVASRLADDRLWAEVLNLGGYDLLANPFAAPEVSRVVTMAANRGGNGGED